MCSVVGSKNFGLYKTKQFSFSSWHHSLFYFKHTMLVRVSAILCSETEKAYKYNPVSVFQHRGNEKQHATNDADKTKTSPLREIA